ncbi:tripartite tricarboxylate transporter substrate binding protein [Kineosporia rhizophila]|uniref:Bug family tripartite tricarboxylate transporter substrate binding protein n=1 Tax=Kineosporia TaxID=49184 RepID=UPI001E4C2800|nr:tripartite tricarboxylate transporter substrate-binding protein [Kineosporia sp. NBRC 101677]MCE0535288.1 tripartite tricarboxylate transporter substrate binding protein [Kineosporia rhizophila]GLY16932.1 C4-dicarboxylate ABC transporter substrate-binding protein [Kineosporia sp. NBRC 101677]
MSLRHLGAIVVAGLGAVALTTLTACGQEAPTNSASGFPSTGRLQIIAPAAPGGGWDGTARSLQTAIEDSDLVKNTQVINVEGAGGTIGLARFVADDDPKQLLVMGATLVGAIAVNQSQITIDDAVPVARLTGEYHVLVVPKDSKFQTLADFTEAFKSDPGGHAIAGGSAGGTDQVTAGLYAEAVGVDPREVNYIPYSGGGEALAAILGGKVAAGISNVQEWGGQIESGDLRVLAVSAPERLDSLDAPTFQEQDVDVELANWRGVLAPPGTSDEQVEDIQQFLTEVHGTPQWKEALESNGWEDTFLVGAEVEPFFREQSAEIRETLTKIGLVQ